MPLIHRPIKSVIASITVLSAMAGTCAWAQPGPVVCTHSRGERMFLDAVRISLERSGKLITVKPLGLPNLSPDDYWTYTVVFEGSQQSFRAIRASQVSGTASTLNVTLGGEIFYYLNGPSRMLTVTSINAPAYQYAMAELACR
jgi:hypothetical protein